MREFECFHGTSSENCESILKEGFRESEGEQLWFGTGIYFFTEGISDPVQDSRDWAFFRAYSKETRKNKYHQYAVMRAIISVEDLKFIDFTQNEFLKLFNKARWLLQEKAESDEIITDHHILEEFANDFGYVAVKANVQIQFDVNFGKKFKSRLPNTTILLVMKKNHVCFESIEKYETGEIPNKGNVYELR